MPRGTKERPSSPRVLLRNIKRRGGNNRRGAVTPGTARTNVVSGNFAIAVSLRQSNSIGDSRHSENWAEDGKTLFPIRFVFFHRRYNTNIFKYIDGHKIISSVNRH